MLEQKIRDVLRSRDIVRVLPDASVKDAAEKMAETHVGAIVIGSVSEASGIFTERDMLERVVIPGRTPAETAIKDVMTPDPDVVGPGQTLLDAMLLMKDHRSRYVLVKDGDDVLGIVSIVDILRGAVDHTYDEPHKFDHLWQGVPI